MPGNHRNRIEHAVREVELLERRCKREFSDEEAPTHVMGQLEEAFVKKTGYGLGDQTAVVTSEMTDLLHWAAMEYFLERLRAVRAEARA
jgi:hypothetical protein